MYAQDTWNAWIHAQNVYLQDKGNNNIGHVLCVCIILGPLRMYQLRELSTSELE